MRVAAALALAAVLAAGAAPAQTPDCANPVAQVDMNQCAAEALARADSELNTVYRAARTRIQATGAGTLLRDAQRAWIAFRDKACEAEAAPYAGGSIRPLVHATCLERLTRRRTEDLRLLAEP